MPLSRRHFLTAACAAPLLAQKRAPERPNILLIIADSVGSWMLGCGGNKEFRTPNIDLLARSGTSFPFHYACTPASSPSLATLLTGRTPRQHGIEDFLTDHPDQNPPQGQAAPPASFRNEVMISDLLAAQGYQCGYLGNWHMGEDAAPQHAFKFWYTIAGDESRYRDPRMSWNGDIIQEKGYLSDLITAKALQFLDEQKPGAPFFLVVSHYNCHLPYDQHPAKYYEMYAKTSFDTIGWERPSPRALRHKDLLKDIPGSLRKFAAGLTALDDQIPPLVSRLDQRGLRDNTAIIFTSSSGHLLGRHGLWSNGHASDPINMYEEVMATPMIWNWRGRLPVEARRPEIVGAYDLFPTLCELAGCSAPVTAKLCGRSYLSALFNQPFPKKKPWDSTAFGQYRNTTMIRDVRFKFVSRNQGQGPTELYSERTDPREVANHAGSQDFVTTQTALEAELKAWLAKY